MFKIFAALTCMLLALKPAMSQEKVIEISIDSFDKTRSDYVLSARDGWQYHPGNQVGLSDPGNQSAGWQNRNPGTISLKDADANGRFEGWFRARIRMKDSFSGQKVGMKMLSWAAAELYLDGKQVFTAGKSSVNGNDFQIENTFARLPVDIDLEPGKTYSIAYHIVDRKAPFPFKTLRSETIGYHRMVMLTSPDFRERFLKSMQDELYRGALMTAGQVVMALFFWLLYFLTGKQKNLLLIAIVCSSLALQLQFSVMGLRQNYSFDQLFWFRIFGNIVGQIGASLVPLMVAGLLNCQFSNRQRLLVIVAFAGMIGGNFLPDGLPLYTALLLIPFLITIYFVIESWKRLAGSQWAVVTGIILAFLLSMVSSVLRAFDIYTFDEVLRVMFFLSLPVALLIYVSVRFREILAETKAAAEQLVQVSEEKRLQSEQQQSVLEAEVKRQTKDLRDTLDHLNETQAQLVQSEKMASLGELTAGIAHEIQNPLNFVNNFSEVSRELLQEMKDELANGNTNEANNIITDLAANLDKINHHGKRADGIVKGMLQHSRSSDGKKELTDINKLCDEYLRLSYHGLRAKDKTFNANLVTDFDASIGSINLMPQEIGRVVLNLLTNAFFAAKQAGKPDPAVTIATKNLDQKIEIRISDNGSGIPDSVLGKIFQPFFTTKKTGEGTGLGLSLSYEIVTKGHGGELLVETKEGQGSLFIVRIPKA